MRLAALLFPSRVFCCNPVPYPIHSGPVFMTVLSFGCLEVVSGGVESSRALQKLLGRSCHKEEF
jgi:hypothetical protein